MLMLGQTFSASEQLTCSFRTQEHWGRSIAGLIRAVQAVKCQIPVNKVDILLYRIPTNTCLRQAIVSGFRACFIPDQGF